MPPFPGNWMTGTGVGTWHGMARVDGRVYWVVSSSHGPSRLVLQPFRSSRRVVGEVDRGRGSLKERLLVFSPASA